MKTVRFLDNVVHGSTFLSVARLEVVVSRFRRFSEADARGGDNLFECSTLDSEGVDSGWVPTAKVVLVKTGVERSSFIL